MINNLVNKFYIIQSLRQSSDYRTFNLNMQPFFNYPNSMQPLINNPASSKALTKLKTGKFIQAEQMQFSPSQNVMNIPPPPRNIVNFGPPVNNSFNNPRNVSFSPPPQINHATSLPNITLKRQNSNLSQFSNSQSSALTESDRLKTNALPPQNQTPINIPFQKNQNPQQIKPQSAMQRTNHASSNGDLLRLRSSSASQFSLNESQKRAANLQSKLGEYYQQILQANMKLNQKERKITQLQTELTSLKQRSNDLQIKLNENYENQKSKDKKIEELQNMNKQITSGRSGLQVQKHVKQEKIKNLEGTLQKMLKSKDLQIQSLNQSCTQLSKHLQALHEKYEQQVRKLTQTIQSQQQTINQNKTYFDSLNERMKSYEQHIGSREIEIKEFLRKIGDQNSHIELLQTENKALRTDLSAHIQELQAAQVNINQQKNKKDLSEQEYTQLLADYNNAKKLGQQQIQFLQNKLQQGTLEKQRLLQQIQLTKVVTLKRNMVFQRQVIYDLKRQNDQLWAKLIQQSELSADQLEKDPMYWSKRFSANYHNINNYNKYNIYQEQVRPTPDQSDFEQRYRQFVQNLQRQQEIANKKITQLNQKQAKNSQQDTQFYKNKCISLQKMVQQHLKINLSLKQQLQKYHLNSKSVDTSSAQAIFVKNQLDQERLLNQTLQRSIDLMKTQYQMRFKAAQARVDQIENENKNYVPSNQNMDEIKRMVYQSQAQIQRLANDNRNLTTQISQLRKWESMYEQLKRKYEQMSPISQYNKASDSDDIRNQLQNISRLLRQRQADYDQLNRSQIQKCQNYEQQLRLKEHQLQLMLKDFQKVQKQFSNGKIRYDQLLKDISRLQKQLLVYKTGTTIVNSQMVNYTIALLRSKLLEMDAFIKQIVQHTKESNSQINGSKSVSDIIIELAQNSERVINDCLNHCNQIQQTIKS